jgi:two-component sensor histidine kinase/CHASE3 domain sensor protein
MDQPLQSPTPDLSARRSAPAGRVGPRLSRSDWILIVIGAVSATVTSTLLFNEGFRRASDLAQAQRWEAHTLSVIATAERTRSEIRNMQRGERGFLLTSNEAYLKPFIDGRRDARSSLEQLRVLTNDNPEQLATLGRLAEDLGRIDARLSNQIGEQRAGRHGDALASVKTGQGERLISIIDGDIDEMIRVETGLLEQRRQALRSADRAASQNRLALSGLGLAALWAVVWMLFRTLSARRRIEFETERAELAEQLVTRDAQLAEQIEELNALYASAPIGLAFFTRDHRYLRINEELARINGRPVADHIGRSVREVIPANAEPLEQAIDQVFRTGVALRDLEFTAASPLAADAPRHWLTGFYPVRNERGEVEAVGVWVLEISERKKAEEREALLAREVDHRAKNLLAVVQSVVQLTQARDAAELKTGITGRIQALARAHSLLADARWDGAQLGALVREELAPYLGVADTQIELHGPELLLRPAAAQSLAIVLHELATNAVKYGALSSPAGRLNVRWSRDRDDIVLEWIEHGGPLTIVPKTSGFGSRIIRASIERQLHGSLEQHWRPEGLQCTIRISIREALGASEQSPA